MRPGTRVLVAWQGVRRRPLRNVLTALSLLVGVLTLVLIQASASTLREAAVLDSVLRDGPATTVQVPIAASADRVEIAQAWKRLLSAVTADADGRAAVVVEPGHPMLWVAGRPEPTLRTLLVDPDVRAVRPFPVVLGGWFGPAPTLAPQLVVNLAAWRQLPWHDQPAELATAGLAERQRVRLAGVVYDGTDTPTAYLSLADQAVRRDPTRPDDPVTVLVHVPRLDERTLLARIRTVAELSGRTAQIGDVTRVDRAQAYAEQIETTGRVFLGIAVLSLLVGSMGILNIGLATLRERADELSLRRAFGATRADVAQIMILEALTVAGCAAVAALAVAAVGLPFVLDRIGPAYRLAPTALPLDAMALGLGASVVAALAGALAPTVRAARVPISSIMRR